MGDAMIIGYAPTALVYDPANNTWALAKDYAPDTGRIQLWVSDDDDVIDGDYVNDEVGDDKEQTVKIADMDGESIASGTFYSEEYILLSNADGGTIRLDLIEIDGKPVGWTTTEPLKYGEVYKQLETGDVGEKLDNRVLYKSIVSVPCFGEGTLIATDQGERAVQDLRPRDRVMTYDRGPQPVLWVGRFSPKAGGSAVAFTAGSLGAGSPARRLRITGNHRVLVTGPGLELHFGVPQMLAEAKLFLGGPGAPAPCPGTYWHILLARHELVRAEGLWAESLFAGGAFLRSQPLRARLMLSRLTGGRHRATVRPCLRPREFELVRGQVMAHGADVEA